MADNFQQFSEEVPALTPDEQAWVRQVLDPDFDKEKLKDAGIRLDRIDLDYWPDFEWKIDEGDGSLWLYSETCGNWFNVAELVSAFLARFRPRDCWGLTRSETCSKPRIGEFGGGGLFVTARSTRSFSAHEWVEKKRKAFQRRQVRKPA